MGASSISELRRRDFLGPLFGRLLIGEDFLIVGFSGGFASQNRISSSSARLVEVELDDGVSSREAIDSHSFLTPCEIGRKKSVIGRIERGESFLSD